ncbi:MAG: phosphoglycerate dehydrogenase [Actinomycetota bacterium]
MTQVAVTPRSFRETPGPHHDALGRHGLKARFSDVDHLLAADEMVDLVRGCSGLIVGLDPVSAAVLEAGPVRAVVKFGSGLDNIDTDLLEQRGVPLATTEGASSRSVAELAIALLFALARNVVEHDRLIRGGAWKRHNGTELAGKRLGIVGFGRIGKDVARIALGLGMEVVAHDPYAKIEEVESAPLDELITTSDAVSLHLPLTEETRSIIGPREIKLFRSGALLVNTARGGVVDEEALADALDQGRLGGVAFDAFVEEPPSSSPLPGHPNFISSPHAGAATTEAVIRSGVMAVEKIARLLQAGSSDVRSEH